MSQAEIPKQAPHTAGDGRAAARTPDDGGEPGFDVALDRVKDYWNTHLNTTQFLGDSSLEEGSPAFFSALQAGLDRFPYKRQLFDRIASLPGDTLLEIGCGLGNDLCELGARGLTVTGIDIAPRAVELARKHLALRGIGGTVKTDNCERLSFRDDSFDIVYSSGVIQHTPDIAAAVSELLRVLRPGGVFVVVLYHRYSWFNLLAKLSRANIEFQDADAPIIRTFSKRELRRLFSAAGNLNITMEHYRPSPTPRRGILSFLFNGVFIPCYRSLPAAMIRRFGWHAVVTGQKA